MQELKLEYNKTLKRYYSGCDYLYNNPKEWDKYLPVVLQLLDRINEIVLVLPATEKEILEGFENIEEGDKKSAIEI